jgi:hypothetical protein
MFGTYSFSSGSFQGSITIPTPIPWDENDSLAEGVWLSLNPHPDKPPILDARDQRIPVLECTCQGYLTHSRTTRDKEIIVPRTEAWVKDGQGDAMGDCEGEFDLLEGRLTWI